MRKNSNKKRLEKVKDNSRMSIEWSLQKKKYIDKTRLMVKYKNKDKNKKKSNEIIKRKSIVKEK